mmetsp:Transcript_122360/g.391220  ORF Transcript_122360/g.391220 Transcript_122360/m.391220 type:complete len:543 (+) Transcript_122360:93-1721(+)
MEAGTPISWTSSDVTELVTFEGCTELRRAVPLARILRSHGRIFADSAGSAATYLLSEPVSRIGVFISHNWAVSRMLKFLALSYHFSFGLASLLVLPFALLLGAATALGLLPDVDNSSGYPVGISCRMLCPLCFLVLMLFGRNILAWFGYEGPSVFLDKVCIHQENAAMKQQGIEKLGAFLVASDSMLVLYSDIYLVRLWTVYELASFLSQREISTMTVVPVLQAAVVCGFFMCVTIGNALFVLADRFFGNMQLVLPVVALIMGNIAMFVVRQWHRERAAIDVRLTNFRLQDCTCFCESDRRLVYSNVAKLMRSCGAVPSNAEQEQALDAFNDLVRRTLPQAFRTALGRVPCQLKHYLAFSAARNCTLMMDNWAQLAHGREPRAVLADSVAQLFQTLTVWCFMSAAITTLPAFHLQLTGWRSVAWCNACLIALLVPGVLVIILCEEGAVRAEGSDLVLAVFVAADICVLIIIVICLRGITIKPVPAPAPTEHSAVDNTAGAFDAQVPQEAANSAYQEVVLGRAMFLNDGSQDISADGSEIECN